MPLASEQSLKWTAKFQDDVGPALSRLSQIVNRETRGISDSFARGVLVSGRELQMLSREHLAMASAAFQRFAEEVPPKIAGLAGPAAKTLRSLRSTQMQLRGPLEAMLSVGQALKDVEGGGLLFQQQTRGIVEAAGGVRRFQMLLTQTAKETPAQFARSFAAIQTLLGTEMPADLAKAYESAFRTAGPKATQALAQVFEADTGILSAINAQLVGLPEGIREHVERALQQVAPSKLSGPLTKAAIAWLGPLEAAAAASLSQGRSRLMGIGGILAGWSDRLAGTSPQLAKALADIGGSLAAVGAKAQASGGILALLGGKIGAGLGPIGAVVGSMVGNVIGSIGGSIMGAFGPLLATIGPVRLLAEALAPVISALKNMLMPLFAPFVDLLLSLVASLRPIITSVMPVIINLVDQLMKFLGPVFTMLANLIATLVTALAPVIEMIMGVVLAILTPLMQLVNGILGPLMPLIGMIVQTALMPLMLLLQILGPILELLLPPLVKIITWILQPLMWILTKLFDNPIMRWVMRLAGGGGAGKAPAAAPPAPAMAHEMPVVAPPAPMPILPTAGAERVTGVAQARGLPVAAPMPMAAGVAFAPPRVPTAEAGRGAPGEESEGLFSTLFSPFGPMRLIIRYLLQPMLKEIAAPVREPLLNIVKGVDDVETAIRAGQPAVPEVDPEFDSGVLHAAGLQEVWA